MEQNIPNRKDTIPPEIKEVFFKDISIPDLNQYDVLGFDLDHCLAKYKVKPLVQLLLRISLEDFREMGYPKEIQEFDYENDLGYCMNHSVFDVVTGLVIKLSD